MIWRRKYGLILSASLLALVIDQATKWAIVGIVMRPPRAIPVTPFLNIVFGINTGVSFGMFDALLAEWQLILIVVKLGIVALLLVWCCQCESPLEATGFGLIAGGVLGNIVDRWRQGGVTDFIDFHFAGWHWPAFNMADVAIFAGVVLIFAVGLWSGEAHMLDATESATARGSLQ